MSPAFIRRGFLGLLFILVIGRQVYAMPEKPPLAPGIYSIGPGGSYTPPSGPSYVGNYSTITAAIGDLNANGAAGNIVFELQNDYTSSNETFPITITYQGTVTSQVEIRPRSDLGGQLVISGSTSNPLAPGMFYFDGADYIHFNGTIGSSTGTRGIKIQNTCTVSCGSRGIQFANDASHNTLTGLQVETTGFDIVFNSQSGTTGCDNNTIQYCKLTRAGNLLNGPMAFSMIGGPAAIKHDNLLIQNNEIADCGTGILFSTSGNLGGKLEILNNHFYMTTSAFGMFSPIYVLAGNNPVQLVITGNYFGGSQLNALGSPMRVHGATEVITASTGDSPGKSVIADNVIRNMTMIGEATRFSGIEAGGAGAFDITNNIIGDPLTTNSLDFPVGSAIFFRGILYRFGNTASTSNISNNSIANVRLQDPTEASMNTMIEVITVSNFDGGILNVTNNTIRNFSDAGNSGFIGISTGFGQTFTGEPSAVTISNNIIESISRPTTGAADNFKNFVGMQSFYPATFTGNRIGSLTNPDDINVGCRGISYGYYASAGGNNCFTNDTLANVTFTNTNAANTFAGFYMNAINPLAHSISNCVIKNISLATTKSNTESDLSTNIAMNGIFVNANNPVSILNNTISGLHLTTTAAVNPMLVGININNSFSGNALSSSGNEVYNLTNTATSTTNYPVIMGTRVTGSGIVNVDNSMISIGSGSSGVRIYGVYDASFSGAHNYYYNTVAISGAATNAARSSACWKTGNPAFRLQNNIFYNARTGGTGKHYAIVNENGTGVIGSTWLSNYNNLYTTNAATLGAWPLATDKNFESWQDVSDDADSKNSNIWFTDINNDLHLIDNANCALDAAGIPVSGITTDINNEVRNATSPDIGADEFTNTFFVDAGSDQIVCGPVATLNGNIILPLGVGAWSVVNGTGSFSPNANTAGPEVSGLSPASAVNSFKWDVTSGSCVGNATVNITSHIASTDPTGLTSSLTEICNGITTGTLDFTVAGGSLGTNAVWKLYDTDLTSGSPVPLAVSSGGVFTGIPLPTVTTIYYARAEGTASPCPPNTNTASINVTVNTPENWYYDEDGDGYYIGSSILSCSSPGTGYSTTANNGIDNCSFVANPGQEDNDNDGLGDLCDPDDDNDGILDTDDNCPLTDNPDQTDTDNDDQGNACDPDDDNDGVLDADDCNPVNASVYPGATEVCNGIDDNCNGQIDEGVLNTYYLDLDGDNYGSTTISLQACIAPAGYVSNSGDCNDNNAVIHPGATEICDNIDNDCSGQTDEGVTSTFYQDSDEDGYGNPAVSVQACSTPVGYVSFAGDCNDDNPTVYPNAPELCDGLDNDCDGEMNEGIVFITYYRDADNDSYGNAAISVQACSPPAGYVTNSADCNDANVAIYPGATEICDGADNDCDGQIDEGVKTTYYRDADSDGYGNPAVTIQACTAPLGYVSNSTDCNDTNSNIRPGETETCDNNIDDDCDGLVDEGCNTGNLPKISILGTVAIESNSGVNNAAFILLLSKVSSTPVTVQYQTSDITATIPQDYVQKTGVVTFPPNTLLQTIVIQVKGDVLDELDETFKVSLSNAVNATINVSNATCTILDNDNEPCIRIVDVSASENSQQAVLQVNLSAASGKTVKVKYDTKDGTAKAPGDYTAVSNGTIMFQPGEIAKSITIVVKKDALNESTEKFEIKLKQPENAVITTTSYCAARKDAKVSILNSAPNQNKEVLTKTPSTAEQMLNIKVPGILPRNSQLSIQGLTTMDNDLMIFDSKGIVIAKLVQYKNRWSPGNIAVGIYFYQLRVRTREGKYEIYRGKIMVTE